MSLVRLKSIFLTVMLRPENKVDQDLLVLLAPTTDEEKETKARKHYNPF